MARGGGAMGAVGATVTAIEVTGSFFGFPILRNTALYVFFGGRVTTSEFISFY